MHPHHETLGSEEATTGSQLKGNQARTSATTKMDSYNQLPPPILPDLVSSSTSVLSPPSQTTIKPMEQTTLTAMDQTTLTAMEQSSITECYPVKPTSQVHPTQQQQQQPQQQTQQQQQYCQMFSLPPPPQYSVATAAAAPPPAPAPQTSQQSQLPDLCQIIEELEANMEDKDPVVLANSIVLLYTLSIDSVKGKDVTDDEIYRFMLCYATGNLTNISKYEEGRVALLNRYLYPAGTHNEYSRGVESLIRSLSSRESSVVIFAITAMHNLLLDRRAEVQEAAKAQIKYGLKSIVQLLDYQCPMQNYEFKVIVLNCLEILAHKNPENKRIIKSSGGPALILKTIRENFDNQPTEMLIETASQVLTYLSSCSENRIDIISHGGIDVLTNCIRSNNQKILKTSLWTLRNLSDMINNHNSVHYDCVNRLVDRLLHLLREYRVQDYRVNVACALGILANLTCNNENVKQFICDRTHGISLLLSTISDAMNNLRDSYTIDEEILIPAILALCHLMNQNLYPNLAEEAKMTIISHLSIDSLTQVLLDPSRGLILGDELSKAVNKLKNLIS